MDLGLNLKLFQIQEWVHVTILDERLCVFENWISIDIPNIRT